jgi:L-asparaginase
MILVTNNEGTLGVPATARMLAEGAHALDAIEAGIQVIEADPSVRTVGRGGWPNLLGEMELDACMMDGSTLRSGAVGALQGFLHPVSVAREIMRRLPHEFLVGDGAARFAREIGAEPADNLIEASRRAWQAWFDNEVPDAMRSIPRWGAIPPCFLRMTRQGISVVVRARPAGGGNIPAASATVRLWAQARTPTRVLARPRAPVPAR